MSSSIPAFAFGLILFIIPFCVALCFKNKIRGFLCLCTGIAAFHIIVALATQYFGIFNYEVIAGINLAAAIVSLIIFAHVWAKSPAAIRFQKYPPKSRGRNQNQKKNWIAIAAFAIVFFELFSVHYFYTGIISGINGFGTVSESSYQYPMFSDEWVGVALTGYSIRSHSLPLVDPLDHDKPFNNFLFVFYSVSAEALLLFGMNPLTGYSVLAIASGLAICFLVFAYLRSARVSVFAASVSVMIVPLIVNAANLPGIWSYMPFVAGFGAFLPGLAVLNFENEAKKDARKEARKETQREAKFDKYVFIASSLISIALYPPMIVFIVPAAIFAFWRRSAAPAKRMQTKTTHVFYAAAIIAAVAIALFGTFVVENSSFITEGLSLIFRNNLVGGIPSFPIWQVVPWFVLILSLAGIAVEIRNKRFALAASTCVGLLFWVFYAYTTNVFFIDYPRIVVMTSFMLVIFAGFGFDALIGMITAGKYRRWLVPLEIVAVFVFIFIACSYPLDTWAGFYLNLQTPFGAVQVYPASPVTRYLTSDDLRLFSGISGQNFIAPEWKGLVIGAATDNYPIDSKASTIFESKYDYDAFMALGCQDKATVAANLDISYVYAKPFSCPDFQSVGSSPENLTLYTFLGKM
jgi:hypothetical protein